MNVVPIRLSCTASGYEHDASIITTISNKQTFPSSAHSLWRTGVIKGFWISGAAA